MLSQSIILEKLPTQIHNWVADDSVLECYKCGATFNWYIRKHHCRGCGRVFCYACSKHRVKAAKNENHLIDKENYLNNCLNNHRLIDEHRVCTDCNNVFSKIRILSRVILIFQLLPLNIKDFCKLVFVSKMWHEASIFYISKFRDIQLTLPYHNYTDLERNLLYHNFKLIPGHNRLMCQFIKSINYDVITIDEIGYMLRTFEVEDINSTCNEMLCQIGCSRRLTYEDAIDIMSTVYHPLIRRYCLRHFTTNKERILIFLPLLTHFIRNDSSSDAVVGDFLTEQSILHSEIRNRYYWELVVQLKNTKFSDKYISAMKRFKMRITDCLGDRELDIVISGENFDKIFKIIDDGLSERDIQNKIQMNTDANKFGILPIAPNYVISQILFHRIRVKNSATKPIFIPCLCKPVLSESINQIDIIYKSEDIRKDNVIMSIIKLMDSVLKENGMDFHILTYDILPTTLNSGFMRVVTDAETLYEIREGKQQSILNYLLENNPDSTIKEVREKIVRSTAAYCVITYLLGIGDRHLDNIMVTKDARLFHIDYGYILGLDPKPLAPYIRITHEMIDALGGENSKDYIEFKRLCGVCYNILRKHTGMIMNMLCLLIECTDISLEQIYDEVLKRFIPNECYENAELQFITKMNSSKDAYNLIDFFHLHSKEETLKNGLKYVYSKFWN